MKKVLFATGIAVLALATLAGAQAHVFNANLSVGSTGAEVTALQTALIAAGFDIPAISAGTTAKGYFGSQTLAAVKRYQTSKNIVSTGFVGPLTRNALNGGTVATSNCLAGWTSMTYMGVSYCMPPGTVQPGTPGVNVTPGTITTIGVPGIITVTQGPLSSIVSNVGQSMVPVLTIRVQAQYSDLSVQSMTLDLGNNTGVYNKIFNKIYITDGTNVLASQVLNSSTVVQSGSDYVVGLAGFNFIVPKGSYKDLVVRADLNPSIDSKYLSGGSSYPSTVFSGTSYSGAPSTGWGIALPANSLRAVDGAGVNLYGPTTGFAQALTINTSLVDTAQANVSLNSSSPLTASIPVVDTTNGQYLGLPVLVFDVNAQNDAVHLNQVKVGISTSGTGSIGAAYLYQGATQVSSASVSGGLATFSNILNGTAGATINKDQTLPYTVKVDVTGVTSSSLSVTAAVATSTFSAMTVYNSIDGTVTVNGSAQGNTLTVASVGPLFALASTPTMTKVNSAADTSGNSTTTYTATFNVSVQAVGVDVQLGLTSSSTPAFSSTTSTGIDIYKNGVKDTLSNYTSAGGSIVVGYSQPSNTTVSTDGTYFTLARNQSVTIPVTYSFVVKNAAISPNQYAVQLQGINWEKTGAASANVNTMKDLISWRTSSI